MPNSRRQRNEQRQSDSGKRQEQSPLNHADGSVSQYNNEREAEFQKIMQYNPRYITTMLPSKQTSTGFVTMRSRGRSRNKLTTLERHTLSRVLRHTTETPEDDARLSMDPNDDDLFDEEENFWDSIDRIKTMTITMTQKKGVKLQLVNRRKQRYGSYEQFKWHKRKLTSRLMNTLKELGAKFDFWRNDMKIIEGHYGSGVKAYFQFLQWLFYLNVTIFIFIFSFVSLPAILVKMLDKPSKNATSCDGRYDHKTEQATFKVSDIFQGTGFMEKTFLFYGSYPNSTSVNDITYNLPLAYLLVTVSYLLLSLISIIKTAVKGFRERLVIDEGGRFHKYCHLVFTSWDFCIDNPKSAAVKQKAIYNEMKGCLESEKLEKERKNRTSNVKKTVLVRLTINVVVLCILAACGFGIFYVFQKTSDVRDTNRKGTKTHELEKGILENLLYEFLPSITIVAMNLVVPLIFEYLIIFETYSTLFTIRLTLIRTIFLRLASLLILYVSLYKRITESDGTLIRECKCTNLDDEEPKILCCETLVGQQIYKLLLTDFASQLFITFILNYIRSRFARNCRSKFLRLVCEQSFDLPRHVLDVVYTQSLCWVGCFYAPLLSAVMVVFSFISFYMKKFSCMVTSKPSATIYRVSRSNSMFMVVTLISYIVAVLPVVYSIGLLEPSKTCGPFRDLSTVWQEIDISVRYIHPFTGDVIQYFYTPAFVVPLSIILVLLLYYYSAVSNANKHMVTVLKKQLVLEGQDKRYLVERLGQFLKQQQAEGDISLYRCYDF